MLDFDVFNECVTDRPTNQLTDQPTDTAYFRDARTHLKTRKETLQSLHLAHLRHFSRHLLFFLQITDHVEKLECKSHDLECGHVIWNLIT